MRYRDFSRFDFNPDPLHKAEHQNLGRYLLSAFFSYTPFHFTTKLKMEQTTAKLRKTFRYPSEDDPNDFLPEAMDEIGTSLSAFSPSASLH